MRTTIFPFLFVAFLGIITLEAQDKLNNNKPSLKKEVNKKEKSAKREMKKKERKEEKLSSKIIFE